MIIGEPERLARRKPLETNVEVLRFRTACLARRPSPSYSQRPSSDAAAPLRARRVSVIRETVRLAEVAEPVVLRSIKAPADRSPPEERPGAPGSSRATTVREKRTVALLMRPSMVRVTSESEGARVPADPRAFRVFSLVARTADGKAVSGSSRAESMREFHLETSTRGRTPFSVSSPAGNASLAEARARKSSNPWIAIPRRPVLAPSAASIRRPIAPTPTYK
jgi:hypothetical protein